jgi:Ni,Fe-hydrogenase I small subunit
LSNFNGAAVNLQSFCNTIASFGMLMLTTAVGAEFITTHPSDPSRQWAGDVVVTIQNVHICCGCDEWSKHLLAQNLILKILIKSQNLYVQYKQLSVLNFTGM